MRSEATGNSTIRKPARACLIDGESDPARLERCNIGGAEVTLCRRCYRAMVERSTPQFPPIWTPPDDLESIAHALLAEADLLSMLAQSRWVFAHVLIDRVRREVPDETDNG